MTCEVLHDRERLDNIYVGVQILPVTIRTGISPGRNYDLRRYRWHVLFLPADMPVRIIIEMDSDFYLSPRRERETETETERQRQRHRERQRQRDRESERASD